MMAKRSKKPADLNRLAASIVDDATNETAPIENKRVEAGRAGGLKGGAERTKRLSPARRTEIARHAANARWGSRPSSGDDG